MDYHQFHVMQENFNCRKALRGSAGHPDSDGITDELALLRGIEKPPTAIRFRRHADSGGDLLCDVVWTALLEPVLISNRVVETFRSDAIAGWATYPVELIDKRSRSIPDYHGLAVTGRCGPIDRSRSRRIKKEPFYPGGPKPEYWVGTFFKDDRWDGSDIFLPEGTGFIIVSERVKTVLAKLSIPNVRFDRLDTDETHV